MEFRLDGTAPNTKARYGTIKTSRSDGKEIQTPCFIANTFRGCVPNLTHDHVQQLPIELVHLSLEHLCVLSFCYGEVRRRKC